MTHVPAQFFDISATCSTFLGSTRYGRLSELTEECSADKIWQNIGVRYYGLPANLLSYVLMIWTGGTDVVFVTGSIVHPKTDSNCTYHFHVYAPDHPELYSKIHAHTTPLQNGTSSALSPAQITLSPQGRACNTASPLANFWAQGCKRFFRHSPSEFQDS